MMKNNSRQQVLLDLLNQLEEDNCIITVGKGSEYLPAVFRQGTKYQVYLNQFSQFKDYDDVTDLIDKIVKFTPDSDPDSDFIEYEIISHEEFYQMRLNEIRKNIERFENEEHSTLNRIRKDLERDFGTYVLTDCGNVKYLVTAISTDEDYYWVYLTQKKNGIHVEYDSCVGGYIALHRYLPVEEYEKIRLNHIKDALNEKNLLTTEMWFRDKMNSTEFVPLTNIRLKR